MPRIALLGTGLLGDAIGHRLLDEGIELGVWNRKPERCQKLLSAGANQITNLKKLLPRRADRDFGRAALRAAVARRL